MTCRILYALLPFFLISCGASNDEKAALQTAQNFCNAFLNLDFLEADKYCTTDSHIWIENYASVLDQRDADSIRKFKYKPEFTLTDLCISDSVGTVKCKVVHPIVFDSIGIPACQSEETYHYTLLLKKESDEKWLIKMEGPLRNEK